MRCTNCGSEVQTDARFCVHCGDTLGPVVPVQHVPAAAPVAPVAPTVAASSLVYLFGDRFVERDTAFSAGEKLPCSEIKVKKKELTQTMFLAAFASLVQEGRLNLTLGQKKTMIFKTNAVFAAVNRLDLPDPGGLEARLLHAMTGNPQKDSVEELVWRVIGETSIDPWGEVIGQIKGYLLPLGFFAEGERSGLVKFIAGQKLLPQCERIATLQGALPAVQALLEGVHCQDLGLHKQLCEDIKKGINSRYEAPQQDQDN